MGFLNKLFKGNKKQQKNTDNKNPDNTKLLFLLKNYSENRSKENYIAVMEELMNGDSYLLRPSDNQHAETSDWHTLEKGATIGLTSLYNVDGLKVLGAFTDENALTQWSKKLTRYTALRAKDVLKICEENKFDRIVINSDQENMFVLERNKNASERVIEKGTTITIGPPRNPLSKNLITILTNGFDKLGTVDEAYQYVQTANNEASLILAVKLNVLSDNSKSALINTLNDVLAIEKTQLPVDVMFVEEKQLGPIRSIEKSLFYKKGQKINN